MKKTSALGKIVVSAAAVLILILAVAVGIRFGTEKAPDPPVTDPLPPLTDGTTLPPDTEEPPSETTTLTSATEPVTAEPPKPAEIKRISVIACGDNILYRPNTWEAQERISGDPAAKLSFAFLYSDVADYIAAADLAFINQETLAAGGNAGYPLFNSPYEIADTLDALGFDVVNMATNHMLDVGYTYGSAYASGEGIRLARAYMDKMRFTAIGGYLDQEDSERIRVLERDGLKIAFLAFTESTNTIRLDPQSNIVIPYLEEELIRSQVALAQEAADFVIVSAHWGTDSSDRVTENQKKYAQLFADLGVDVVIGTHPHLLQPIEWIEGNGGKKMLCAYSLGNFMAMMEYPNMMLGGFLSFEIIVEDGQTPRVEQVGFTPTVYHYNASYRGSHVYWLDEYTEALAAGHGVALCYGHSFSVADLRSYLKAQIAPEYLLSAPQKEN